MITQTSFNLTDLKDNGYREYNGWANWTTWNCALWIGGDEGFYNEAKYSVDYIDFINNVIDFYPTTPDGLLQSLQKRRLWNYNKNIQINSLLCTLKKESSDQTTK